jgi:YfiH family protein
MVSVPYLSIPAFQDMRFIVAAVSTRIGGVSQNPYHSLNLGYHVGDAHESVAENRRRFCSKLDIDVGSLVISQQIHGNTTTVINDSHKGHGAYGHEDAISSTDGMITESRGVALAVLTADCVPVLVVDPLRKAIGIAHAGWRGALSMIAARTVLKMRDTFGTEPADCLVALGPSIGPCCYKAGEDVISQFQRVFGPAICVAKDRLDLQLAVQLQLAGEGVEKSNISSSRLCTACNRDLFYSYRAEGGRTGRMMSVITLI